MTNTYLVPGLRLGARALQGLVEKVPPDRWDEAIDPGRFTFREAIAHMVDWEPIMLGRIRAGVESDGVVLVAMDEGERAITEDYASWNPVDAAALFVERREETLRYYETLSDEQRAHITNHPERGPMTVYDWANTMLGHDTYHIEQLVRYL